MTTNIDLQDQAQAPSSDYQRAIADAVGKLESLDRTGREWVCESLWSNIFRDGIAAVRGLAPPEGKREIPNPARWFYAYSQDAEWWHGGLETRDAAILQAGAGPDPVFITRARKLVPDFKIFDAGEICERFGESEVWGEDGWEGQPDTDDKTIAGELEDALAAVFARWVARHGKLLDGAQLDFIGGPERVVAKVQA